MTEVKIPIPHQHILAKDFWIDEMVKFCLENNYGFSYIPSYYEDGSHLGKIQVTFNFENTADASHFALRWADNDWGMMWHPV